MSTSDLRTLPPELAALVDVLEITPLQFAIYSPEDVLIWCNKAWSDAWLRGRSLPLRFEDFVRQDFAAKAGIKIDCGDVDAFLAEILPRRRNATNRAFATDRYDGTWLWITETRRPDGWFVNIAADITPIKRAESSLRTAHDDALQAARTDVLTGLPNRRFILELAAAEIEVAAQRGALCAIALVDIDRFKPINDTHGHGVGDAVLRHLARCGTEFLRRRDRLGRLGGDEFLAVFPDCGVGNAADTIDRFRARLSLRGKSGSLPAYSFSAGVALARAGEPIDSVLARADKAMYEAKNEGRSRTAIAADR